MVRVNLIGFDSYARKLAAAPEEIVKEIGQELVLLGQPPFATLRPSRYIVFLILYASDPIVRRTFFTA